MMEFTFNTIILQDFSPDGQYIISADRDFKIRVRMIFYVLLIQWFGIWMCPAISSALTPYCIWLQVTNFSKECLKGAHEIQCFCLGHTE